MAGFTGLDIIKDGLSFYMDFSSPKFKGSDNSSLKRRFNPKQTLSLVNNPTIGDDYLTLDGTNDYIDIELPGFSTLPTITISAWIKWESSNGGMFFGFNTYDIWTSNGTLGYNNGQSNVIGLSSTEVNELNLIGNWHHYTFVMNRFGLLSQNKIYVDGVSYELNAVRANDGNCRAFTNTLTLGSWNNRGFYGHLSYRDLKIYDRELTEREIIKVYNLKRSYYGLPRVVPPPPPPPPPTPISTTYANAYEIKQNIPDAESGYYYIENPNINSGNPFLIYADMETDGGGWTLIVRNVTYEGWNATTALEYNTDSLSYLGDYTNENYSILSYADALKSSPSGFQYMIEANIRGQWGGIWTANQNYSFTSSVNTNTDITLDTKFGSWTYSNNGIEERMPYYSNNTNNGILTTSELNSNSWWGTIIAGQSGWYTAPWISSGMSSPQYIWYWVR